MAELNLKQIVDKLNTEFTGEHRKLVFWYDDKGDFAEDIDSHNKLSDLCTFSKAAGNKKPFGGYLCLF